MWRTLDSRFRGNDVMAAGMTLWVREWLGERRLVGSQQPLYRAYHVVQRYHLRLIVRAPAHFHC